MKANKISFDLAKETFNFSEIPNLNEIEELHFDNYSNKIEIPLAINKYPNITKLSFLGKSKEDLFEIPDQLEQLIHIRDLTLWKYCDLSKLKPMPQLEELYVAVKNVETDTKQLNTLFPNLKKITVWGNFLKKQLLPIDIGNLHALESLRLIECGLSILPDAIVNLKQLQELELIGLPLKSFPEVITRLENLENLKIRGSSLKLPNSLSNLTKLKKLDLNGALNQGETRDSQYLKPIPSVIGALENLEELNLGSCKVFDISPITPLKKIKKLNLRYSVLTNCAGFSSFTQLEDLDLSMSYDLVDLEALKGLPIKKLELLFNPIKSIEIISSLKSLETLDIESCKHINDFSAVYNHPTLKALEAEHEILENWEKRGEIRELPPIKTILGQLETDTLPNFEEAIFYLSKLVNANYARKQNPIKVYFNIVTEEAKIAKIPILDNGIQKHIKSLSEKTLITIFEMTFKSVQHDNYNASLIVLEEIIARKNVTTQEKIVKQFYDASKFYDAGHRFWGHTVHDQLIDDLFPQFTSEALYELLEKASTDMLNSEGGDQMEDLFIPAFQNTTDLNLQTKVLEVFFRYEEKAKTYYGKEYFIHLLQQIREIASPELEKIILAKKEENKEEEELSELLENLNQEDLPKAIGMLGNKIPKKMEEDFLFKINQACDKNEIDEEIANLLMSFLIRKKENSYLAELLQSKYHKTNPEKIISILSQSLTDNSFDENEAYNLARMIITDLVPNKEVSFDDLEIYRNFIVSKCNISIDTIYNNEVQRLLSVFFNSIPTSPFDKHIYILEKVKEIFSKTEAKFSYSNLYYDVYYLVKDIENEQCRTIFNYLSPGIKNYSSENVLYLNVIAAIKLNDTIFFDAVLKKVQKLEEISQVLLAFNLSCGFAHFGRKEEMFYYIKESIRLGKTKQQFLDDTDFEKYWNDGDFLKAIDEE